MSTITVTDLEYDRELDHAAMSAINGGGGAPWIYGWITPFTNGQQSFGGVVNIYDITNNFTAGQMINQFQNVDVNNTGNGATLTVNPTSTAGNRAG